MLVGLEGADAYENLGVAPIGQCVGLWIRVIIGLTAAQRCQSTLGLRVFNSKTYQTCQLVRHVCEPKNWRHMHSGGARRLYQQFVACFPADIAPFWTVLAAIILPVPSLHRMQSLPVFLCLSTVSQAAHAAPCRVNRTTRKPAKDHQIYGVQSNASVFEPRCRSQCSWKRVSNTMSNEQCGGVS